MDIAKVIGIGMIALTIILILKKYKPELAMYVSIIAGIIILTMSVEALMNIVNALKNLAANVSVNNQFIKILLKITGIAILTEFATSICKDAGETAIASKIEIASKVLVVSASIPIISGLLELVTKILPN